MDGDAFFVVGDTAPGVDRGTSSVLWLALALFAVGLVIRWFFVAVKAGGSEDGSG